MALAFPNVIVEANGTFCYHYGHLFTLPPELSDSAKIARYASIRAIGWSKTELGYMALVREDGLGRRVILPGLNVHGVTPAKRIHGYKSAFSREQVEEYLDRYLRWQREVRDRTEAELSALVHDLRHLSSSIYHSAERAKAAHSEGRKGEAFEALQTVIASQTMLKVRIDYLDFVNSVDRFEEAEEIPVYSRVHKVIRCFSASAEHKKVSISLKGSSFRLASGPNILDIVPYTIIENAIKYSPRQYEIRVQIDDLDVGTEVRITSTGPVIGLEEREKIFQRHVRGKNAQRVRPDGTGLGLAVAKEVVDVFGGRISVHQEEDVVNVAGVPFCSTTFRFEVPTAGEDHKRRLKVSRYRERSKSGKIGPVSLEKNSNLRAGKGSRSGRNDRST